MDNNGSNALKLYVIGTNVLILDSTRTNVLIWLELVLMPCSWIIMVLIS